MSWKFFLLPRNMTIRCSFSAVLNEVCVLQSEKHVLKAHLVQYGVMVKHKDQTGRKRTKKSTEKL